jgi:hypothetical protein
MPGHIKLGKPGTPDEDPTAYLVSYHKFNTKFLFAETNLDAIHLINDVQIKFFLFYKNSLSLSLSLFSLSLSKSVCSSQLFLVPFHLPVSLH